MKHWVDAQVVRVVAQLEGRLSCAGAAGPATAGPVTTVVTEALEQLREALFAVREERDRERRERARLEADLANVAERLGL